MMRDHDYYSLEEVRGVKYQLTEEEKRYRDMLISKLSGVGKARKSPCPPGEHIHPGIVGCHSIMQRHRNLGGSTGDPRIDAKFGEDDISEDIPDVEVPQIVKFPDARLKLDSRVFPEFKESFDARFNDISEALDESEQQLVRKINYALTGFGSSEIETINAMMRGAAWIIPETRTWVDNLSSDKEPWVEIVDRDVREHSTFLPQWIERVNDLGPTLISLYSKLESAMEKDEPDYSEIRDLVYNLRATTRSLQNLISKNKYSHTAFGHMIDNLEDCIKGIKDILYNRDKMDMYSDVELEEPSKVFNMLAGVREGLLDRDILCTKALAGACSIGGEDINSILFSRLSFNETVLPEDFISAIEAYDVHLKGGGAPVKAFEDARGLLPLAKGLLLYECGKWNHYKTGDKVPVGNTGMTFEWEALENPDDDIPRIMKKRRLSFIIDPDETEMWGKGFEGIPRANLLLAVNGALEAMKYSSIPGSGLVSKYKAQGAILEMMWDFKDEVHGLEDSDEDYDWENDLNYPDPDDSAMLDKLESWFQENVRQKFGDYEIKSPMDFKTEYNDYQSAFWEFYEYMDPANSDNIKNIYNGLSDTPYNRDSVYTPDGNYIELGERNVRGRARNRNGQYIDVTTTPFPKVIFTQTRGFAQAEYDAERSAILLPYHAKGSDWRSDPRDFMEDIYSPSYKRGWFTSRDFLTLFRHEFGHHVNTYNMLETRMTEPDAQNVSLMTDADTKRMVPTANYVSGYAAHNSKEFNAEVFAGIVAGKKFTGPALGRYSGEMILPEGISYDDVEAGV